MEIPAIDEAKCLMFLSELVKIKSDSMTEGEREVTAYMTKQLEAIGLEASLPTFADGKRQNSVGIWRGTGGQTKGSNKPRTLLFNGHLDTNPVTEGWTVNPLGGKVDEEFIYGIGVSNMKSSCAAYYCAVATLKVSGWKPRGDVILTFVVGELQGGRGTQALIEQDLAHADYFINGEPTDLRAITMHAEGLVFEIELFGNTRHLSAREEATDAILAACELIPILTKTTFRGALSEEHQHCNRCSVGIVHGALGKDLVEWRPPQVSDYCRLSGAARYAPGQSRDDVMATLDEVVSSVARNFTGLKYKLHEKSTSGMPAFQVSKESPIVATMNKAHQQIRNEKQPTGAIAPGCFFGSDASHLYKKLGMEAIVCGSGGRYNTRPDEKVDISDYLDLIRVYMFAIKDICG